MENNDENRALELMLAERMRLGAVQRLQEEAGHDYRRSLRRTRWLNSAIVAATVVAVLAIVAQSAPDALYASNQKHRTETLDNIDQILYAKL